MRFPTRQKQQRSARLVDFPSPPSKPVHPPSGDVGTISCLPAERWNKSARMSRERYAMSASKRRAEVVPFTHRTANGRGDGGNGRGKRRLCENDDTDKASRRLAPPAASRMLQRRIIRGPSLEQEAENDRGGKRARKRKRERERERERERQRQRGRMQECIHRAGELWGQLSPGDNSYSYNKVALAASRGANCSPKARARSLPLRDCVPSCRSSRSLRRVAPDARVRAPAGSRPEARSEHHRARWRASERVFSRHRHCARREDYRGCARAPTPPPPARVGLI